MKLSRLVGVALLLVSARPLIGQETPPATPPATTPEASPAETAPVDPAALPGESETDEELPRAEDVPLPSAEELLEGPRHDWIILRDGRLLVVEPVLPRPDTLGKIQAERNAILADSNRRASPTGKGRLDELFKLGIFLPGDEASEEFKIRVDDIAEIVHHEELMLRRVDRLIDDGDTRKAFEMLFVVARTDPAWPGLDERQVRLTAADASRLLGEGDGERGLALIESLYERNPAPEPAARLLDRAADLLVGPALEAEDFRKARGGLARVRRTAAGHPAVARWTGRLVGLARSLRADAERASAAGDHAGAAALVEKAARAWPALEGLKQVHARLTRRHQRLTVGVPSLADEAPVLASLGEERTSRLTRADLFEIEAFETSPSYRSGYFDHWEPTDLGRRARFALRPALPAWSARSALTASEVVAMLGERMRPGSRAFDARFADLVRSLRPLGPYEFEVVFSRIPPRTESALIRPSVVDAEGDEFASLLRRFVEVERTDDRAIYHRAAPDRSPDRHVAEVAEFAFPDYRRAAQAFDRGDVRMLAEVPAWDVRRLRSDKRFAVTRLAIPVTHVVQFHPASEPLKSTELRRAFAASADARALLRLVAGEQAEEFGRVVTAPYPSTHRGYDSLVEPRTHDLPLALALTLAAEKRAGGKLPDLLFAIPSDEPGRSAAGTLAQTWKRIGLPVRAVPADELGPSDRWDLAYRELTVADPAASLAPLITLDPTCDVSKLADLPPWLRGRLFDLERATDTATAEAILIDLHRLLYADVRSLPLFEVDRFVAVRGILEGLPERPVTVYQNAERWSLLPDYPEETP